MVDILVFSYLCAHNKLIIKNVVYEEGKFPYFVMPVYC